MGTPYSFTSDIALAGQVADLGPTYIRSLRNDSGSDKPFGIAVTRGATDDSFDEIDTSGDEVIGIVTHTHAFDVHALAGTDGVPDDGVANVLALGVVNVLVEVAVTPADDVYVRYANGIADPTMTTKGAFGKAADTSTARRLHGARYLTSASAGGFAQVFFVAPVSSFDADLAALQADIDAVETRIAAPAASEAAIKAIAGGDRSNGMVVVDLTNDVRWTFDSGSSATASAWVLVPDAGTGRWLRNQVTLADLASTANAKGAGLVGIEDVAEDYTATTVEAALAEVKVIADAATVAATLALTTNGNGASLVGVEDADTNYTGTNVEAVLAEVATMINAVGPDVAATFALTTNGNGISLLGVEDADGHFTGTDGEAVLAEVGMRLPIAVADPGTGVAIPVTHSASVPLVIGSAGAETNTLDIPMVIGQQMVLTAKSVGTGTRAVTAASAINVAANTIMTFSAALQTIKLEAVQRAAALGWQVVANDGVTLS